MFNAGVFYAPLGDASLSPLISNPDADCGERRRERDGERVAAGRSGKAPCKRNFYAYVNAGRNLSGLVTNLRRKQKLLPLALFSIWPLLLLYHAPALYSATRRDALDNWF